ncbi:divalent metal cation transporter [Pontiellaceae bacterium B12219]|nr:divalent metal cation transporter [Pontiellaceae bacterium B12219]
MEPSSIESNRELINSARKVGKGAMLKAFIKLSGPGWLQSAITLGGGSLATALYLGVLGGLAFLWLQPIAMIMGIIMLSAIGYITLSTGEKPFRAINKHVNPVLGWGWIIATLLANCVWALPQFNLATAATRQNLMPGIFGEEAMPAGAAQTIIGLVIAAIAITFIWSYDSGKKGVKIFDGMLKGVVGMVVISFFGVVVKMATTGDGLPWGEIVSGFIPDLSLLSKPTASFDPALAAVSEHMREFWTGLIIAQQRDVMIGAAATAVGINMTLLLPYSMLKRGWDKDFRGMAIFDLSTGLFIPFLLVTSCIVIVASSQFHAHPAPGLLGEKDANGQIIQPASGLLSQYKGLATQCLTVELGPEAVAALSPDQLDEKTADLPLPDRRMAAMLVKRDAGQLAQSLAPLTGSTVANAIFGFGVTGMAVSTIIVLMLINGFVICEIANKPMHGLTYKLGAMMPLIGIIGPFVWGQAKARFWLAVPTSVFGMVLLPIAYFSFFLLMNSKSFLKENMPTGGKRIAWNTAMLIAASLATFGSLWSLWSKLHWTGIGILVSFITLAIIVHVVRKKTA